LKSSIETQIWDKQGNLRPLNPAPTPEKSADVGVIIVNRDRKDLTDALVNQVRGMAKKYTVHFHIVEMGSEKDKRSGFGHLYYPDPEYRGKCYGHNVGLRWARNTANYRYYWVMMNDLVFNPKIDALGTLIQIADQNPKIAVLSPTEPNSSYINCKPRPNLDFHCVTTCDYLSLLVRAEAVNAVGFLNPMFKYCWGAIHEFSYKLYKNGWWVAYCDKVSMNHLGGTTYGTLKNIPSREQYKHFAAKFASTYFVKHYGKNWDKTFSKVLPPEVRINAFPPHKKIWESFLTKQERKSLYGK